MFKRPVFALLTLFICAFAVAAMTLAPSVAIAGDDSGDSSDGASGGGGDGGGPGKTGN